MDLIPQVMGSVSPVVQVVRRRKGESRMYPLAFRDFPESLSTYPVNLSGR